MKKKLDLFEKPFKSSSLNIYKIPSYIIFLKMKLQIKKSFNPIKIISFFNLKINSFIKVPFQNLHQENWANYEYVFFSFVVLILVLHFLMHISKSHHSWSDCMIYHPSL